MTHKQKRDRELRILKWVLIGFGALLALTHVIVTVLIENSAGAMNLELKRLFDLDNERNIPTFYTGLLLASCGLVSAAALRFTSSRLCYVRWALLASMFFYLALDEIFILHERLAEPVRDFLAIVDNSPLYHAWVLPAIGVTLLLVLVMLFIKPTDRIRKLQRRIFFLIIILAAGVILLEIIGTQLYFSNTLYKLGPVFIEEAYEIGMISFILYTLTKGVSGLATKKSSASVSHSTVVVN